MPIEFRCSRCGRLLRAADDTSGKSARCPECGTLTTIPDSSRDGEVVPPAPPGPESAAPQPGPPAGSPFATELPSPTGQADPDNPYQSPTQYGPVEMPPPPSSSDSNAMVSLILGCVGLFMVLPSLGCCVFGMPVILLTGTLGLWFGVRGLNSPSRGLAIAGIVLCAIQLVLAVALIVLIVVLIMVGSFGP